MFRQCLPAVLFILPLAALAETTILPPLGGDAPAPAMTDCVLDPGSPESCSRVLACIGTDGLYFDGGAIGWNEGVVQGRRNDGVSCDGTWRSGGLFGTGTARLLCGDGLSIGAIYYNQDGETGTAIGRGTDSRGRSIIAWTGENVLAYLTPDGSPSARLPCGATEIPIS